MIWRLPKPLSRWMSGLHTQRQSLENAEKSSSGAEPLSSESSEPRLPPPPRDLISHRVVYEIPLLRRRVDFEDDTPTAALYRLYEHFALDQSIQLRNGIEAFWWHPDWPVRDIPDPRIDDDNAERLACLACIPKLLCLAFNKRIEMGLPHDAPPIFTQDMLEEWRKQERNLEQEPEWVAEIPPLVSTLVIPH